MWAGIGWGNSDLSPFHFIHRSFIMRTQTSTGFYDPSTNQAANIPLATNNQPEPAYTGDDTGNDTGNDARGQSKRQSSDPEDDPELSTYQQALQYLDYYGFAVIPLKPQSKIALLPKWQETKLNADQIETWFNNTPNNIGIVCGEMSERLVVIDFDDKDVFAEWSSKNIGYIITPTVQTAKGYHLYYKFNGELPGNSKIYYNGSLAGDCKSTGGYVVAPPSIHESGVKYRWERRPSNTYFIVINSIDELGLTTNQEPKQGEGVNVHEPKEIKVKNKQAYIQAAYNKIFAELKQAKNGDRNNQLSRATYQAARLTDEQDSKQVIQQLYAIAGSIGLLEGDELAKTERTIKSNWERGQLNRLNIIEIIEEDGQGRFTDLGNAKRIISKLKGNLYYIHERDCFVYWDGKQWKLDTNQQYIHSLYISMVNEIRNEIGDDAEINKKILAWASHSEGAGSFNSCLVHLKPMLSMSGNEFDTDDYLLNCQNGIYSLKDNVFLDHDQKYKCSKMVNANYNKEATAPKWIKFISDITLENPDYINYLQIISGYILSGDVAEKCAWFCYGDKGDNGKSTFLTALLNMMGDYAKKIPSMSLMVKNFGGGINNDIASIRGARLVIGSEVSAGQRFDDGLIRDLVGGDAMTARFLRQEFFTFTPKHKILLYGNQKPSIAASDRAIRKKIKMMPFMFSAVRPDYELQNIFKDDEADGILNWMIEGWKKYQQLRKEGNRLVDIEPIAIKEETTDYFDANDPIGQFIAECFDFNPNGKTPKDRVYEMYSMWAIEDKEYQISKRRFGVIMKSRYEESRDMEYRYWKGIVPKNPVGQFMNQNQELDQQQMDFVNAQKYHGKGLDGDDTEQIKAFVDSKLNN